MLHSLHFPLLQFSNSLQAASSSCSKFRHNWSRLLFYPLYFLQLVCWFVYMVTSVYSASDWQCHGIFFVFFHVLLNIGLPKHVSFGTTVPEDVEWYLYSTRYGAVLGLWTCRSGRKWNRRQAGKGRFSSAVCWTWAFLGVTRQKRRRRMKRWMEKSIWYCGVVLVVHRDRLGNWSLAQTWLQGPDCCPLMGHSPGLLLA